MCMFSVIVEVVHEIFCRRTLMEAKLDEMSMGGSAFQRFTILLK